MAVEQFEDKAEKIVRCKWFEGNARHEDTFYVDAICHYPGAPSAASH